MNSRRRFFRSLAQTAALIALAPQLAKTSKWRVVKSIPTRPGRACELVSGWRDASKTRYVRFKWVKPQTPATTK